MEQVIRFTPQKPARREFIRVSVAASVVVSAGALMNSSEAWALELKALKPETARTLIQMARDIYPHDRIATKYYAVAIKGIDAKAAGDAKFKAILEKGVADLNARAKKAHQRAHYENVGWEIDRVKILKAVEKTPFFQAIRGDLVVSLYNQQEVWPVFGYEGESASKGGYINRGFNDLTWL